MLDRTQQSDSTQIEPERPGESSPRGLVPKWVRGAWRFFVAQSFSSVTRRIVSLNVAGLLALVIGILYLSQFRAGLIDARIQTLLTQGVIIARAR